MDLGDILIQLGAVSEQLKEASQEVAATSNTIDSDGNQAVDALTGVLGNQAAALNAAKERAEGARNEFLAAIGSESNVPSDLKDAYAAIVNAIEKAAEQAATLRVMVVEIEKACGALGGMKTELDTNAAMPLEQAAEAIEEYAQRLD